MGKCNFNPYPLMKEGMTIEEYNKDVDDFVASNVELVPIQYNAEAIPDSEWEEIIKPIIGSWEDMGK